MRTAGTIQWCIGIRVDIQHGMFLEQLLKDWDCLLMKFQDNTMNNMGIDLQKLYIGIEMEMFIVMVILDIDRVMVLIR